MYACSLLRYTRLVFDCYGAKCIYLIYFVDVLRCCFFIPVFTSQVCRCLWRNDFKCVDQTSWATSMRCIDVWRRIFSVLFLGVVDCVPNRHWCVVSLW